MNRVASRVATFLIITLLAPLACQSKLDDKETLLQVDRDFARATASRGVDGWISYFAEDGMMLPEGAPPIRGREAIRSLMASFFAVPGNSLEWEPRWSEISRSGDLGYTIGTSVSTSVDSAGQPVSKKGKYLTVWRKMEDGNWRVAADIGNEGSE